jgi:hypothetical protein
VEQSLITATALSLDEGHLRQLGDAAEEMFEVLYGRGELASERCLPHHGDS